jgi:bidirectional [NiFe] hydrogenase diaphorase subunit
VQAELAAPKDDKRWRIVEARIRRAGAQPDALIEVLHTVQETFGYLDTEALAFVSAALGIPPSRVYGVATFYSLFTLKPSGEHTCVVCTGTVCYIDGSTGILSRIRSDLGILPGETTGDNKVSLLTARCIGACSMAPVVIIDGEVSGGQSPDSTMAQLRTL